MKPIITPLTFEDAVEISRCIAAPYPSVVDALMAVDRASYEQRVLPLIEVLRFLNTDVAGLMPDVRARVREALYAADPESEPIEDVCARMSAAGDAFINSPANDFSLPEDGQ